MDLEGRGAWPVAARAVRAGPRVAAFTAAAIAVGALLAMTRTSEAVLPAAVDGQPMPSLAPMIERATPAVVNIATEGHVQMRLNPLFNDPFFRRFFNIPDQLPERRTQALGSGVIIDSARGLVVTNNHVIANADQIRVKLRDGRVLEADLVGSDPDTDVAVIKIPPNGLTALPLADSDALRVGDFVVAIGNPFGLGQTVTSGIVSALARSGLGIGEYEDYIQTDASINPGNSGGALVNLRGELVGINTAIFSQSGGNIGIGFAIPVNNVRQVVDQLVKYGQVKRGYLGVELQNLNPELAQAFGITQTEGAVIVSVAQDSPAEKSGLRQGDVVVAVNGRAVRSAFDVRNQIGLTRAGERLEMEVVRAGGRKKITTQVSERESGKASAGGVAGVRNPALSGATFSDIPDGIPEYQGESGVFVADVERGSRAWRSGLRPGDLITSVQRQRVESLDQFLELVQAESGQLLVGVRRGNGAAFMVLK
ncbi:MAG: Periplasmic serine endoprotease DegP [Gammaproteobacteria bacterium]|nr:Periplasmic serine endoprotease DegP [Gammaproteobacteria bacterium]